MSLKILIGRNKSGKTYKLLELKKTHEANKKTSLYIPSVIDLNNYIEKEKQGSKLSDPKTSHYLMIEFINKILSEKIKKTTKYTFDEIKENNKNTENLKSMKNTFEEKSKNDIFFEKDIIDLLQINTISEEREFKLKNILEFNPKFKNEKNKTWDENCSSGSINYSLLKLLGEFMVWSKNQDYPLDDIVLIIDEPEKFSHPELIQKISDEILNISKYITVEIATHSGQLVERIFNKAETDDEIEYNKKWRSAKLRILIKKE